MHSGSAAWDRKETKKEVQAISEHTGTTMYIRDYPVLVAASGRDEQKAIASIEKRLTVPRFYIGLPPGFRTAKLR